MSPAQNLIIIGGGLCIDAMRDLSQRFRLDETRMHWRCVELLRTSYEILGELTPALICIGSSESLSALISSERKLGNWLIAVDSFYSPVTSHLSQLPVGWGTTTDSIAAYLANLSGADELCLIKSCLVTETDLALLAENGVVDSAFPIVVPEHIQLTFSMLGETS